MRKYAIFAIAVLVALWGAAAYAEVQNVKVSGKVEVKGVYRDAYVTQGINTLYGTALSSSQITGDEDAADANGAGDYFITTTELAVSADLTDNVSANVVFRDEREFGGSNGSAFGSNTSDGSDDLYVAAAYFDLKEFLYAPLSIRAGFWGYRLGSALILADGTGDSASDLTYADLNKKKSFDGIVANYTIDNGNIELGFLKPRTTGIDNREGEIYVFDVSYDLDGVALLGYYVYDATVNANNDDARQYIGGSISGSLMEGLTGSLEVAYLFGNVTDINGESKDYKAYAIDAALNYVVDAEKNANVGLGICYRSGDKDIAENGTNTGDYEAWSAPYGDQTIGEIADVDTNVIAIKLSGAVDLMEDVTLSGAYYHFIADEKVAFGSVDRDDDLGDEIDAYLTWDYTSDVQFGLTVAAFFPGDAFDKDDTALEVLGDVTVNF